MNETIKSVLKGPNFFRGQSLEKLIIDFFMSIKVVLLEGGKNTKQKKFKRKVFYEDKLSLVSV